MNVYYGINEKLWKGDGRKTLLKEFPVTQNFLWGTREIHIPALYIGKDGVVADVCSKLPTREVLSFQKKWDRARRLSLKSQEDYEQIDAENPGSRDFLADLCLDGQALACRMSASLRWYPEALRPDRDSENVQDIWHNDIDAEALIEAYGLDQNACWHLGRILYDWKGEPILSPKKASLVFHARPVSVTAAHFTTIPSLCNSKLIIPHPVTGQEYSLTLHECEEIRHDFSDIGAKDMRYPEYGQILSYSLFPETEPDLFEIRDCGESDPPRPKEENVPFQGSSGCTALFLAGKNPSPHGRIALSSMHFEPVREIRWRAVFQVKLLEDLEVDFPIPF